MLNREQSEKWQKVLPKLMKSENDDSGQSANNFILSNKWQLSRAGIYSYLRPS